MLLSWYYYYYIRYTIQQRCHYVIIGIIYFMMITAHNGRNTNTTTVAEFTDCVSNNDTLFGYSTICRWDESSNDNTSNLPNNSSIVYTICSIGNTININNCTCMLCFHPNPTTKICDDENDYCNSCTFTDVSTYSFTMNYDCSNQGIGNNNNNVPTVSPINYIAVPTKNNDNENYKPQFRLQQKPQQQQPYPIPRSMTGSSTAKKPTSYPSKTKSYYYKSKKKSFSNGAISGIVFAVGAGISCIVGFLYQCVQN